MAAKSPEARKMLRELDRELAQASASKGVALVWSAQEAAILGQLASGFGPKAAFLAVYEDPESDLKARLKLSSEIRLLEGLAARLVKQIRTDVAQPESLTMVKTRRAANRRWNRDRNGA